MAPKLFQFDSKDEAWHHAWAERDQGRIGLSFIYAAPIDEAAHKAAGLGTFGDVFGDIFGGISQQSRIQDEEKTLDRPRPGYLLVCWPYGQGLTQQGHSGLASKYGIVEFVQADRLILSLTDGAIEQAVELVVSGTAEHNGHMMPPK
ncbi:hypothetical protein D9M68_430790 [compost metagenome]